MKIGFFDSGIGGLTILKATRYLLPDYSYVFYGDTAHVPYGDKSEVEVYELTKKGVEYLFAHDAVLVILACNTASAETARKLQEEMLVGVYADRKILGVIVPTVEEMIACGAQKALVIGTKRTIDSQKYEKELAKTGAEIALTSTATPTLVPHIEAGNIDAATNDLAAVIDTQESVHDTIVLACTHYTLLKDALREAYDVTVISQDELIPKKIKSYLDQHPEIAERLTMTGGVEIKMTGTEDVSQYAQLLS